jgi:small-conductance mechanosensitive channel
MSAFFNQILQILITLGLALLAVALWQRTLQRMQERDWIPPTVSLVAGSLVNWTVIVVAGMMILESFGLPIKSVWTGLLSVMVMVAVAFFASWSVLSNILSSLLLLTFSRLRVGDTVELRDTKRDEFGITGRVVDINAFFVTLQEAGDNNLPGRPAQIQIPNHLFFYRVMRRWPGRSTQPLIDAYKEHEKHTGDRPETD